MAYCVYSDVAKLLLGMTIDGSSKVTSTDVTNIIIDVDAWIDAMLSRYYSVPITGTESLKILAVISKYASAAEILRRVTAGITGTKTDNKTGKEYQKKADDMISAIQENTLRLADATKSSESGIVLTGEYDENGEEREPKFKIDDKF